MVKWNVILKGQCFKFLDKDLLAALRKGSVNNGIKDMVMPKSMGIFECLSILDSKTMCQWSSKWNITNTVVGTINTLVKIIVCFVYSSAK